MGDQLLMQLVAELFSPLGSPRPLFRMSLYFFKPVRVTHDLEIETPVIVYASLPQVTSVIVPFFAKGWVVKIAGKKSKLFTKGPSKAGGASSNASSTRSVKSIFIDWPMCASLRLLASDASWH
jgi:hypothetical protein